MQRIDNGQCYEMENAGNGNRSNFGLKNLIPRLCDW